MRFHFNDLLLFSFSLFFSFQFSPFSLPLTYPSHSPSAYLQIIVNLSKTLNFLNLNLTSFNRTRQCLVWESWKGFISTHSVPDFSLISGLRKVVGNILCQAVTGLACEPGFASTLKGHYFLALIGQAPSR